MANEQWPRALVVAVAAGRTALGAAALALPRLVARPWVGAPADPAPSVLGRALGGRDLALGAGALTAAARPPELRRWALAGALADTADVLGTLLRWPHLPTRGRWAVLAAAGAAAAVGWAGALGLAVPPGPAIDNDDRS